MLKRLSALKLFIFITFICPATVFSADIFKADKYFTSQQYDLALEEYIKASQLGNPHAYYQLGIMFQKGLGVKKDTLNSLIYMSMAADYPLEKAQSTFSSMMTVFDDQQKITINNILNEHKQKSGKAIIQAKYFPTIIIENLAEKITFDGEDTIDKKFFSDEFEDYLLEFEEGGSAMRETKKIH
ncbi:hypothetical protein RS130_00060 [Paraglaciecola aquimarina]|uniref:Sel1 repeat family protein n=1 Tax=Paraglaciecola aquimarina TaxID=1235557 RepID=A0ABU3SR84_9ALTE|nr:hypothetical protein [Paraglaciecola aquimarina]MDU0352509.1 hypothetical protein [Paraglaciecola aquimarina]